MNEENTTSTDLSFKQTKFLLDDRNYERIRNLQRQINDEADVTPSIRKIINELVSESSIEQVKSKLLNKYLELS